MTNDLGPRLVATGTDSFAIVDPDGNEYRGRALDDIGVVVENLFRDVA